MSQTTEEIQEEIAAENRSETIKVQDESNKPNIYFAICGEPPLPWLSRKIVGSHAIFDHEIDLWIFETKEEVEEVIKNNPKTCSELIVGRHPSKIMDTHLHGTKNQKKALAFRCSVEIKKKEHKKDEEKFDLDCHKAGICKSVLSKNIAEEFPEHKNLFQKLKDRSLKLEIIKKELEELETKCNETESNVNQQKIKEEKYHWSEVKIPFGFEINDKGVWSVTGKKKKNTNKGDQDKTPLKEGEDEECETTKIKICDPIWVAGRSRDFVGSNSGIIVHWIDMDGIKRETCIERSKLHKQGSPVAEELAHNNLSIVYGKEKELSRYLLEFTTDKTYRAVKSLGWLENPTGELLYVSKTHTFRNANKNIDEEIVFQPNTISKGPSPVECGGTLKQWKEHVATPCKGNDLPIFLQSQALSGTIIKYADVGSTGTHISGTTSKGKTTVAQTAASTFGCGADPRYAPKLSIIKTWLATANALESLAAQSSDCSLILDEIGQCPGSDLDKIIYNLFGGRGKERLNQQVNHRETRDWVTVVISTGERTLQERLVETNSKAPAGLFVRFIDLHFTDNEGVFTTYHGIDEKTFVDNLKRDCGLYYGTAATAFIQKIVDTYKDAQTLRASIASDCAALSKEISGDLILTQEHARVLKLFSFAALAGIWASKWDIFPYSVEEILSASRNLFVKWHSSNQKQNDDVKCICAIRDYYIKKRDSTFRPRDLHEKDTRRYTDVYGYLTNEGKFYLTKEGLNLALGPLNKLTTKRILYKRGYLLKEENEKRYDSKKSIDGVGSPRVFVFSEKICEFDEELA